MIAVTLVYHECPEAVKVHQLLCSPAEFALLESIRGTYSGPVGLTDAQVDAHYWLYNQLKSIPARDHKSANTLIQSELIVTGCYL